MLKFMAMRYAICALYGLLVFACGEKQDSHDFQLVVVENLFTDTLNIRAIVLMDGSLAFAADKGTYGSIDLKTNKVRTNVQLYDGIVPEFRAVAHTQTDFFMLSVANPALLYKTGDSGKMELVYKEEGPNVFYDALLFLNDSEGIAVGDSMNGCLSIILSRDGGNSWLKVPCSQIPSGGDGEGAFAASNTNIAAYGDTVWIGTTSGRVYISKDKGETWEVVTTPILNKEPTQGIYSMDFYDGNLGVAIGGDYTQPEGNRANKAITLDGGQSWQLIADGDEPGYKSCIQFVPNSGGRDMVAVGFTGISYSSNGGNHWKTLSDEPFYTIRFLNDSVAYAAGKDRIAKLIFR